VRGLLLLINERLLKLNPNMQGSLGLEESRLNRSTLLRYRHQDITVNVWVSDVEQEKAGGTEELADLFAERLQAELTKIGAS
jgi:hypothetical protein